MKYTMLGIMMHGKCSAECDICSVNSSPYCDQSLDVNRLEEILFSCCNTEIRNVSFTGGEPFLEYSNLMRLIQCAVKNNLKPSVVTNGFWAINYDFTVHKIRELKQAGLAFINISYDKHHAKYIPHENIDYIIAACEKENLPYVIAITKMREEKIGDILDSFHKDTICLKTIITNCQPAGRAKDNYSEDAFSNIIPIDDLKCMYDGVLTIHFSGKIFPCCAHQVFESELSIGDYRQIDVKEALYRIKNNSILYLLRNYGVNSILEMNEEVKKDIPAMVSSPCEVCAKLFMCDIQKKYFPSVNEKVKELIKNESL